MKRKMQLQDQLGFLALCQKQLASIGVNINVRDVLGKSRQSEIVFQRALVAVILRSQGFSFSHIGSIINRDHATAINLLRYARKQKRNPRWEKICQKALSIDSFEVTSIKNKIAYYQREINKLDGLLLNLLSRKQKVA